MPFGLTNAPSTFQAVMNDVFREYLYYFVMVYIDDILIFSRTAEDHLRHVELILARLRQHQQFAKLSKCEFGEDRRILFRTSKMQSKALQCCSWPIFRNRTS
jgi:Reverse transcriptase (RNA-dependent DNA polymerase)